MKWLRRNGPLLAFALAVVGTLFATRQLALAVKDHEDSLLHVQVTVARAQDAIAGVFGESQDVFNGSPAPQLGYERSVALRMGATQAAHALARQWRTPISRRAEAEMLSLGREVEGLLRLIREGRPRVAAATNALSVIPRFNQATRVLAQADAELRRETAAAASTERWTTLVATLGASLLLMLMMLAFTRARRTRDLARSERRLVHEAEERLRALVHNSSDVIVVVAADSTVLFEAGSISRVLGRSRELLHGTKLTDLVDPEDVPLLLTLCNTVGHEDAEVRILHPQGGVRAYEIRATSLLEDPSWKGVVLHIWDVSDRKTLELELRLAQKLEAVGQLAAGIAHEINTPIQYVGDTSRFLDNAFAELMTILDAYQPLLEAAAAGTITPELLERVEEAEETADLAYLRERIPQACERTVDGVHRVSKIVSAMRAFAHPPTLEVTAVDVNEAVANTLIVATNEYKYVADVTTNLGELPLVECNAGDINQVLLNLIVNAAHAIADVVGDSGARGSIHVCTQADGDEVVISVADTGGGIAPEVAERVFDPFFTTKEVGRGTGQGLTLSRTIVVERHGGSLTFDSRPGKGTTFFVRLPVHAASAADRPRAAA
jgi:PAS domain S-box-containing protein